MKIKCVVACSDANGKPTFYACVVDATPSKYAHGEHYVVARGMAEDDGYGSEMVVYDEKDGPAWLFENEENPRC